MPSASGPFGRSHPRMHLVSSAELPEPSDAELVRAVREQQPRAADRVWERYSGLVRRILRRSLGPSAEVEDALQDSFLRLFRDLGNLREPSALRSFLIGITLHVATSELRRRRAKRWLLLSPDGVVPERDPEPLAGAEQLQEREALRRLYAVLDRVGTQRRLVFVLRYVEGLELAELSAVLGCSLATTKRRVADAARRVCRLAADDPALAPYLPRTP
jgi:RNA polymerase sigma-70 factor (ECF subfamily)